MTIKIEKDIPLPESVKGPRTELTAALAGMNIGDSVLVTGAVCSSVIGWGHRQNPKRKFVQRKQPDGSTRVWRVT